GSSRGIGLALARGLAEAGCTVVLNGRDADRLTKAAAGLPGDIHTAVFDVTDGPSVAAGMADVEQRVGPLDILVNNAGMQLRAPRPGRGVQCLGAPPHSGRPLGPYGGPGGRGAVPGLARRRLRRRTGAVRRRRNDERAVKGPSRMTKMLGCVIHGLLDLRVEEL